jgi:uncharacterized protein YggL (DUF469 family)
MAKHRSRRVRKKLRVGEFQQFGFDVSFRLRDTLREDELVRFWDAFILDAIERNRLAFGGGTDGFVCAWGRGSLNDSHRELLRGWLTARPEVLSSQVGPLVDAWHPPDRPGL